MTALAILLIGLNFLSLSIFCFSVRSDKQSRCCKYLTFILAKVLGYTSVAQFWRALHVYNTGFTWPLWLRLFYAIYCILLSVAAGTAICRNNESKLRFSNVSVYNKYFILYLLFV